MTSDHNNEEVKNYFSINSFFGLKPNQVAIFIQDNLPLLSLEGKIMLETPQKIMLGPNGIFQ